MKKEINVIIAIMWANATFFGFSSFFYQKEYWLIRIAIAVICLGFGTIIFLLKKIVEK